MCCRGPTNYFLEASYELVWFLFIACGHGIGCNEVFGGLGIITTACQIRVFLDFQPVPPLNVPLDFGLDFRPDLGPYFAQTIIALKRCLVFGLDLRCPDFRPDFHPDFFCMSGF